MYVKRLLLHSFRAYSKLHLELTSGLSVFIGPNAAGKTSLVEAIHFLATTKSHRTNNDSEMVRWGEVAARVDGLFISHEQRPVRLTAVLESPRAREGGGKRLEVDGQTVAGARDLVGRAPVVTFGPDDLAVIKSAPGLRRRFLNTAIAQLRPVYLDDLARYRRALRQRNELLKRLREGARDLAELAPWTEQLLRAGASVSQHRRLFVADLGRHAAVVHGLLGSGETLALSYQGDLAEAPDVETATEVFRSRLAELSDLEVRRGTTLAGPHRDDLEVSINDASVRQYGSQGQQRTAALSLKLGQARVCQEWSAEPPLLLLDDCLSELDPDRARAVLNLTADLDGLIVTTAKMDPALTERSDAVFYEVADGEVMRRS